jgi:hypothetical protein
MKTAARTSIALWILCLMMCSMMSLAEAGTKGALDGRTYLGTLGVKGLQTGGEEKISFKNGALYSSACTNIGFKRIAYKTRKKGDVITFTAKGVSKTEGKFKWQGTIQGDDLNASTLWKKPGEPPSESWVKAKLVK